MSGFQIPLSAPVGTSIYENQSSNATASVVSSAPGTVYGLEIDNRANDTASWTKLFDSVAPSVGTTDPELWARAAAGKMVTLHFGPDGIGNFGTGVSEATVTEGGGTAGTTSPTNPVIVRVHI